MHYWCQYSASYKSTLALNFNLFSDTHGKFLRLLLRPSHDTCIYTTKYACAPTCYIHSPCFGRCNRSNWEVTLPCVFLPVYIAL